MTLAVVTAPSASAAPAGQVTPIEITGGRAWAGIAAGPDGNMWFTDGTDNRIGRIGLSTGTGIAFFSTGITGTARPQEIAAGPDGNLWFTENVTGRVARITPDGSIHEYGPAGSLPDGIAAGPDGNMWFHQEHAIGRITPDGTITSFPNESSTLGRIAAGSDGAM